MNEFFISAITLKWLGVIGFIVGVIQMLPTFRKRAKERGLSGGTLVPLTLITIGFVGFMIGELL